MILRRLRIALLGATFLYAPAAARAEPISTAIGLTALIAGTGISAAAAGTIGGIVVSGAISVGANLIANAVASKPDEATSQLATPSGVQSQLTAGAATPRNRVFGKQAIAGKLDYWRVYGSNNEWLQMSISLGSGPHQLFGGLYNGAAITLGESVGDLGQPILEFDHDGAHHAFVKFYRGLYDQEADAELVAHCDPASPWPVTNRGRGVCYVRLSFLYAPEAFPNGIPTIQWIIGAQLYDRRRDSTNGGAGAHRWDDQSTWEFSDNVAVGLYNFERGLTIGGHLVIGRGLAPVDMLDDYFVGSSNVCDEDVATRDGGTEPRYRVGMNVGADRDYVSVERDFCTAMAGDLIESAGAYGPIAGVAQAIAMEFTDADLIQKREVRYSQKRSRSVLVNAVYGTFTDPAQGYASVPYAPRTSPEDEAADGMRYTANVDVVQIQSETQAQRVVEILRRQDRLQGSGVVTLGFKFSPLEAGDWVKWTSARRRFTKVFKVTQHQLDDGRAITLNLDEISADVYGEATLLDPQNPAPLPGVGALISTVPGFSIEAQQVDGAGGLTIPTLRALWSPILDRTVDSVVVQYRIGEDDGTLKITPPFAPADGEGRIADGIQAGTPYQARAIIYCTPPRAVHWTDWGPVTAPARHVVPFAQGIGAGGADWTSLSEEVKERFAAVDAARERAEQTLAATQIAAKLADFERRLRSKTDIKDADERLGTRITFTQQTVSDLSGEFAAYQVLVAAQLGDITANATSLLEAMATQQAAFAAFQLTVNTQLGDLSASVETQGSALSTLNESVASLESSVTASLGDLTSTVTTLQEAVATIDGKLVGVWGVTLDVHNHISGIKLISDGSTSTFTVAVDAFQIASPSIAGGAGKTVFQVGTRGGVADVVMKGTMIVDGGIITNSLSGDAAFYSRDVAVGAGNLTYGNNTNTTFVILSEMVTVAKNHLQIFASHFGSGSILYPNDSASIAVYVDGAPIFGGTITGYTNSVSSNTIGLNGTVTTSVYGLAPGTHTVAIVVSLHSDAATAGNPQRRYDRSQAVLIVGEPRNPEGT